MGTSALPQNMESCLAIMCPMDKGCRAQVGDTSTGFTPDEDHFFQLHLGYSSHAQVLLLQMYLLLLPLPAFSGFPQDPSRLDSSPPGDLSGLPGPLSPYHRGDASLCRHRSSSAAGRTGGARPGREAEGEEVPWEPAHQALQVLDPRFPPVKQTNKNHGNFL